MITLFAATALLLATADVPDVPAPIVVAAASDLQAAFTELAKTFEAEGNGEVSLTFGSTGMFAKQLKEGAPFDVFAAANVSYVDDVVTAGACDKATKVRYARGRIVVWTRTDAAVKAPRSLADLADARFTKIAIANPQHAPYGAAAKQALAASKIWDTVSPRLVLGENVRHTLHVAHSGNADAAIVALSLALPNKDGVWFEIDETLHEPLHQALVVCTRGANRTGGEAFARYVASAKGKELLQRYGFAAPSMTAVETVPAKKP